MSLAQRQIHWGKHKHAQLRRQSQSHIERADEERRPKRNAAARDQEEDLRPREGVEAGQRARPVSNLAKWREAVTYNVSREQSAQTVVAQLVAGRYHELEVIGVEVANGELIAVAGTECRGGQRLIEEWWAVVACKAAWSWEWNERF